MNEAKRKALEKAGFRVGTVQDFLGLSDWEHQVVELKYRLSKAVKRRREALGLTQQAVAKKLESSQSRVAKIEAGSEDVSLDLLIRYLYAVGGGVRELEAEGHEEAIETAPRKPTRKAPTAGRKVDQKAEVVTT